MSTLENAEGYKNLPNGIHPFRVGDQAMHSCLCLLLALLTTTALGSWQYHLEEESDSCDDEDFLFDEEEEGCLDCEIEEKEESSIARVSKRGKSWGENTILKPRWNSTIPFF